MEARKILSPGGVLPFHAGDTQGTYGIILQYSPSQVRIHYEMECQLHGYLSGNPARVLLDRKKMCLENFPPGKIYALSSRMAECIYPLRLVLEGENKLKGLINQADVAYRADRVVKALWDYYPDRVTRRCLELFRADVASPNFLHAIENDLFFQLYFYPLYTKYSERLTAEGAIMLPINGSHTRFSTTAMLMPLREADSKIEISVTGQAPGRLKLAMFSARYLLFGDDHSISSIKGTLHYEGEDRQPHSMTFEIYRLDPEMRTPVRETDGVRKKPSVFICVEEPIVPKGFWNFS